MFKASNNGSNVRQVGRLLGCDRGEVGGGGGTTSGSKSRAEAQVAAIPIAFSAFSMKREWSFGFFGGGNLDSSAGEIRIEHGGPLNPLTPLELGSMVRLGASGFAGFAAAHRRCPSGTESTSDSCCCCCHRRLTAACRRAPDSPPQNHRTTSSLLLYYQSGYLPSQIAQAPCGLPITISSRSPPVWQQQHGVVGVVPHSPTLASRIEMAFTTAFPKVPTTPLPESHPFARSPTTPRVSRSGDASEQLIGRPRRLGPV